MSFLASFKFKNYKYSKICNTVPGSVFPLNLVPLSGYNFYLSNTLVN